MYQTIQLLHTDLVQALICMCYGAQNRIMRHVYYTAMQI